MKSLLLFCCFILVTCGRIQGSTEPRSVADSNIVFEVVHNFDGQDGASGVRDLIEGSDGLLYGITWAAGTYNDKPGVLFSVRPDGNQFRVIHNFDEMPLDVMEAANGRLYGTLQASRAVFEIERDGTGYRILRSVLPGSGELGLAGPLTEAGDGAVYGATEYYSVLSPGGIGRIRTDGTGFAVLHTFVQPLQLVPPLRRQTNGLLVGLAAKMTGFYPTIGGIIFQFDPVTSNVVTLVDFEPYGCGPTSTLLLGSDGAFYGFGVVSNNFYSTNLPSYPFVSIAWRATSSGDFTILHEFNQLYFGRTYSLPRPLLESANGRLIGALDDPVHDAGLTSVISLNKDGTAYAQLWQEAYWVDGPPTSVGLFTLLKSASDGAVYGTTLYHPDHPKGQLLRIYPGALPTELSIQGQIPDRTVAPGSRLFLAAPTRGVGPLSYQWFHEGAPLANATNDWMVIPKLVTNQYGSYSVSISNSSNSISAQFGLLRPDPMHLQITSVTSSNCELRVIGSPELWANIEMSTDLKAWATAWSSEILPDPTPVTIPRSTGQDKGFFRAAYLPLDDIDDD